MFDGDPDVSSPEQHGPVDVRFSKGESADDLIVRLASAEKGEIVLVSSDRHLRERVRAVAAGRVTERGASALFEEAARARAGGEARPETAACPGGNRITEELKKLWLDDEE